MKNNQELPKGAEGAIILKPLLTEAETLVTANDGFITLPGNVDSLSDNAANTIEKQTATLEKKLTPESGADKKNDNDIANEILQGFKWNLSIPNDKIKVTVVDGWVTLEGELQWNYQKEVAKKSVCSHEGVRCITDNITINTDIDDEIDKEEIVRALACNWSIDDKGIQVKVSGHMVTLNGTVQSWFDKDEAARIAWNVPGVLAVENRLAIVYSD